MRRLVLIDSKCEPHFQIPFHTFNFNQRAFIKFYYILMFPILFLVVMRFRATKNPEFS